jgi:hypothetical protein
LHTTSNDSTEQLDDVPWAQRIHKKQDEQDKNNSNDNIPWAQRIRSKHGGKRSTGDGLKNDATTDITETNTSKRRNTANLSNTVTEKKINKRKTKMSESSGDEYKPEVVKSTSLKLIILFRRKSQKLSPSHQKRSKK